MPLHLIKLSVGTESVEDLAGWQAQRIAGLKRAGIKPPRLYHQTFQAPKRREDLLAGGSIYWVIKGVIQARQPLIDIGEGRRENGTPCCMLYLADELIPVRPTPRRAFQGWRYYAADDAPPDLVAGRDDDVAEMPPALRRELAGLGLL